MKKSFDRERWQKFLKFCHEAKNEEELDLFMDLFLTFDERKAVADRYGIIDELLQGEKTQKEISSEFGVGIATVTRGSNYLKTISKEFESFLKKRLK